MDKSRVEHTIFFIEKISFSLKLFSGHFYGQSFIKTVRGPLLEKASQTASLGEIWHARIQRGGVCGSGPPVESHKAIGFLGNTRSNPLENYKASIQFRAVIGPPAKRH